MALNFSNDISLAGIQQGNTANRPQNPVSGLLYYNSQLGYFESYTENGWFPIAVAPTTPTNITATNQGSARAYNNGQAAISFTPNTSGGSASSFIVRPTPTTSPATFSGTTSPVTVTNLTSSTQYTYTVIASSPYGNSSESDASSGVTATTVPQAPTIGATTVGSGFATVAYTGNATGGSAVTTYTATSNPGGFTGTGASPITVSGLTNGTAYTFTVTATNANGTSEASSATSSVTPSANVVVNYLVVAGGGAGAGWGYGCNKGSGGGAGGYRNFTSQALNPGTNYAVTVGAGGAGSGGNGAKGSNSTFANNSSTGGGGGAGEGSGRNGPGGNGGSGGGASADYGNPQGGTGNEGNYTPPEGYDGNRSMYGGFGGGSGGAAGASPGPGTTNSITGTNITYAKGGGSVNGSNGSTTATVNSGDGGNGFLGFNYGDNNPGFSGGSGVVILRYSNAFTITVGAGLTGSTTTVGSDKVTKITAGTGNVSWA